MRFVTSHKHNCMRRMPLLVMLAIVVFLYFAVVTVSSFNGSSVNSDNSIRNNNNVVGAKIIITTKTITTESDMDLDNSTTIKSTSTTNTTTSTITANKKKKDSNDFDVDFDTDCIPTKTIATSASTTSATSASTPTASPYVWFILLLSVVSISFWFQAVLTEERFVPALTVVSHYFHIPNDIAGATLMAAGASSPETLTSFISVFVTHSSLGLGTIVGSEVFNQLILCTGSIYATKGGILCLDPYILWREIIFYIIGIVVLYLAMQDIRPDPNDNGTNHIYITFADSCLVVFPYVLYVIVFANFDAITSFLGKKDLTDNANPTEIGSYDTNNYSNNNTINQGYGSETSKLIPSSSISTTSTRVSPAVDTELLSSFSRYGAMTRVMHKRSSHSFHASISGVTKSIVVNTTTINSSNGSGGSGGDGDGDGDGKDKFFIEKSEHLNNEQNELYNTSDNSFTVVKGTAPGGIYNDSNTRDEHKKFNEMLTDSKEVHNREYAVSYGKKPSNQHGLYDVIETHAKKDKFSFFLWQRSYYYSNARMNGWQLRWFTIFLGNGNTVTTTEEGTSAGPSGSMYSVPDRYSANKYVMKYPPFTSIHVDEKRLLIRIVRPEDEITAATTTTLTAAAEVASATATSYVQRRTDADDNSFYLLAPSKEIFDFALDKMELLMELNEMEPSLRDYRRSSVKASLSVKQTISEDDDEENNDSNNDKNNNDNRKKTKEDLDNDHDHDTDYTAFDLDEEEILMKQFGGNSSEFESLLQYPYDGSGIEKIAFVTLYPFRCMMHYTVPDVRRLDEFGKPSSTIFMGTVANIMCLVWMIIASYAMVASLEAIAELLDVPDALVGVTVSAAGTSIPGYIGSVVSAQQGFGNMAVSNAFGSNTFKIMIGLGLPWLLYTISEPYHELKAEGMTESIIILGATLAVFIVNIVMSGCVLYKWHAILYVVLYVVYVVYEIAKVYTNRQD